MLYDIYFHNDFDGRASAAVMLAFLRSRGDDIEHFTPIDFDLEKKWMDEKFFTKFAPHRSRNPIIIVDFLFHPAATFWFDHHPTSIKKDAWRKKLKRPKFYNWNVDYPSCCHWVLDALQKNFQWNPPKHLIELAKWLDVIDGARYRSAKQAIEMKETALQLEGFIEKTAEDPKTAVWILKLLAEKSVSEVSRMPRVKKVVESYRNDVRQSLAFYKKNLKIFGKLGFIDLTKTKRKRLLYAPFYLHPNLRYGMRFTRKDNWFHISAGENPWKPTHKLHIGKIMASLGGGGHKTVGGVEFYSEAKGREAVSEIIHTINQKG